MPDGPSIQANTDRLQIRRHADPHAITCCLKPLHERMFAIYALSRSRESAFGGNPAAAGFGREHHQSFGAALRADAEGREGFRRDDGETPRSC
jgi:hypothetical protein